MKRILFVLEAVEFGGVEKSLIDIIKVLINKDTDITVMSIYKCEKLKKQLPEGTKYQYLFDKGHIFINRFFKIFSSEILSFFFIRKKYDYIVSYQEGIPTKLVSGIRNMKIKKYCWQHNDPLYNDNNLYYFINKKKLIRYLMNFDKCISVSNYIKNQYRSYLYEKINSKVTYNLIDDKNVISLSKKGSPNTIPFKDGFKFCCIGRLSEEKMFFSVVSAVKKIRDENYDVNLTIIGSGPEKSKLVEEIRTNNLEKHVKILDFVENPYIYMKDSDAIVCSSKVESFGLVVAEAMVLNKRILSTRCGGPEELMKDYPYGVLVHSAEEIYSGFHKIMNIEMNENGKDFGNYPFFKTNVKQDIIELFS
ncbi:glycosyltransferase [Neobacillus notoginsengisoli]|uniref:Glycosyltransferase n=1 Tax=Neobacillus notoginsengisoli TaxID=1578198 RepID=A0A417YYF7_9BACI|nr:glycosyltransferase [Neobacillus notoginsengisoli]RHW42798.1 glycosyltransferase [Neobacillus notoginsengisoli]